MSDMERDAYKAKAQAKIDEWAARLKQIEAKARGSSADAAIEFDKAADDMRARIEEMRDRLAEDSGDLDEQMERLSKSAEGTWQAVKDRLGGKE